MDLDRRSGELMRFVTTAMAAALVCALVGCADSDENSSTFPTTNAATTSETSSTPAPATVAAEIAPATTAEPTDPTPVEPTAAKDAVADDEPEWRKSCLPFIPCFPPDPPPPADDCPPFDPICQTNAAMDAGASR